MTMITFWGIVYVFGFGNLGVLGCGSLKAISEYEGDIPVGKIRLYPNSEWDDFIRQKNYEWARVANKTIIVGYFLDGVFKSANDTRLSVKGTTLFMKGMTKSDVGEYRVICFDPVDRRKRYRWSEGVHLTFPTKRPTTLLPNATILLQSGPGTRPSAIEDGTGDSSGDVAVVVTMTAIIVVLILVILGLVVRMKVKNRSKQLDRRAIAKEEETQSSEDRPQQGENVYNEIDDFAVMDPNITYAQVKETSLFSTNINTGKSPNLPKREEKRKEQQMTSQTNCGEYVYVKEEGVPKDVYSQVVPRALREKQKNETTVDGKAQMSDGVSGEIKTTIRKPQRSTLKKSDVQYKSMDCILIEPASDMSHEYSNTLPRSIKRKGSKSKTELTYIQIDHGPKRNTSDYAEIEPVVIGEAPNSAYVSIDFDKKAFVAPIRKAPSSWYRKRKERKEKKNKMK